MPARMIAPLVALAVLLAGCARPQESEGDPTTTTVPTANGTTTPPTGTRVTGFLIQELNVTPASGDARALREDDAARITYTLVNPATAGGNTDYLVSFILNGEVVDVTTVRLAAGGTRDVERVIEDLRDMPKVTVAVRAGSEHAAVEATVSQWPRTGTRVDLGPLAITANRWLLNTTDGWTDVNVTIERRLDPDGNYSFLRVRGLCADARGNVTTHGEARPNVPEPGMSAMSDVHVPPCPETIYGVEITALDALDQPIGTRILFVERGWRPAGAS